MTPNVFIETELSLNNTKQTSDSWNHLILITKPSGVIYVHKQQHRNPRKKIKVVILNHYTDYSLDMFDLVVDKLWQKIDVLHSTKYSAWE